MSTLLRVWLIVSVVLFFVFLWQRSLAGCVVMAGAFVFGWGLTLAAERVGLVERG